MKLKQLVNSTAGMLALTIALGLSAARAADSNVPKSYPLKTCVVSGDKLGGHGKSVKVTAPDGTDVYLCCKDCVKDFKKDPGEVRAKWSRKEGRESNPPGRAIFPMRNENARQMPGGRNGIYERNEKNARLASRFR